MTCRHTEHLALRSGLTLVETVVALTLLALCLTGLAGTGAVSLRRLRDATDRQTAARIAGNRLQRILASGCAGATSGSTIGSFAESWMVTQLGPGERSARVAVAFSLHGAPDTVVVEARLAC